MADLPEIPEWLAKKISAFIRASANGQVTLSWTQHQIASFDFREIGKIAHNSRLESTGK